MKPISAADFQSLDSLEEARSLAGGDLEEVFWTHKSLRENLARRERYWAATNQALEQAYKDLADRTRELKDAQTRILELERQRTEQLMAGGFAHEIRNALGGARLLIDRALRGERDGEEQASIPLKNAEDLKAVAVQLKERRDLLSILRGVFAREESLEEILAGSERAIVRSLNLAAMLMDYAKMGVTAHAMTQVDALACCEQVIAAARVRFPSVAFELRAPSGPVLVQADETRLRSAIENLVLNASDALIDPPCQAPLVLMLVEVEGSQLRITVRDNGPGVPDALRGRIFEPFFSTKPNTGTGLGLPFAQRIVSAFGGALSLAQADTDAGAVFLIELPLGGS